MATNNFDMGENVRKEIAEGLGVVLADTYTLYLKTQNFHWNVEGPRFRSLHLMFEEQYRNLATQTDELAERIRALGSYAPASFTRFGELSTIKESKDVPKADQMVTQLLKDYATIGGDMKKVISSADDAGDSVTADLLTAQLTTHEKNAWMLRSTGKGA
jgi:starvation-inducible DNA-binding protein